MEPTFLYPKSAYASLAWPTHLGRDNLESWLLTTQTPLFVHDNLNNKKNLGDFVLILTNSRLGTKPTISFDLLHKYTLNSIISCFVATKVHLIFLKICSVNMSSC